MGAFTDYLENKMLGHLFGTAYTAPTTVYMALSTTTPTDAGGNVTQPSGNGYARVAIGNNSTNWNAASGGTVTNKTAITFPEATGSWGTVTHFVLYDAATAGNALIWGALTASKAIGTGDTASFAAGALSISLD